jgi:hypothetical protein
MKNTVLSFNPQSNSLGSYRKEKHGLYRQYTLLNFEKAHILQSGIPQYDQPLIIRVYWPAETAYACLWLSTKDVYAVGRGKAGGWGYCKESQAIENAFLSAGLRFEQAIGGVGESAVMSAIKAFADFAELKNYTVTIAHA